MIFNTELVLLVDTPPGTVKLGLLLEDPKTRRVWSKDRVFESPEELWSALRGLSANKAETLEHFWGHKPWAPPKPISLSDLEIDL